MNAYIHKFLQDIEEQAESSKTDAEFKLKIGNQMFTVDEVREGKMKEQEICPNGFNKEVSLSNYEEYMQMVKQYFVQRDSLQMEFFLKGFYEILPKEGAQRISWKTAQ